MPLKRSSESEPVVAKKPKDSSFPKFPDGDVIITLHRISFQLHSEKLRKSCDYFARCDEKFKHFALESSDCIKPVEPKPIESPKPEPVGSPKPVELESVESLESIEPEPMLKRNHDANENVFRLLYERPLACTSPQCLLDTSILATRYGCVDKVKDTLALASHRVCTGGGLFRKHSSSLLVLAYNIREGPIFSEAFRHVVGRGEDVPEHSLPVEVPDLIASYTAKLKAKIDRCWTGALLHCSATHGSIPNAFAAALMQAYMHQTVAYSYETSLTRDVYDSLLYIFRMKDVGTILENDVSLLNDVDCVSGSMYTAQRFAADMSNYHDDDEDEWRPAVTAAQKAAEMGMDRQEIKVSLDRKLKQVQAALKPLFEDDEGAGYFTCMKFEDAFPW